MFTIRFKTNLYRPDLQVTIRNGIDGWDQDIPGVYKKGEWKFTLQEGRYNPILEFKFVLEGTYWMFGGNILIPNPAAGQDFLFDESKVVFPAMTEAIVENSHFQQTFFKPNLDENHEFDVIVIGSGIGGGIVADQLADLGCDVLVLEAGSLLFSTHTANLPRQHQLGVFEKHLWSLFDEYKVINYVNGHGSQYGGGQAFNLGGRSVFWGGFIPRMTWWELDSWPQDVRWDLESFGYQRAEDLMYWPAPPPLYQQQVKNLLANKWTAYDHFDAPMAVRSLNPKYGTLPTGLFSTADLLTEARLSVDPAGPKKPAVNLNHAVIKIEPQGNKISRVIAQDLLAQTVRTYKAKYVVLAAGTIESAKIAMMSGLPGPLVGVGITDHPVLFTHFSVSPGKPWHRIDSASKTLSRHKQATATAHSFNVLLELGADLNQGRYLDEDTLKRHRALKGDAMLCEIVFLFNSPLLNGNKMTHAGPSYGKPVITMAPSASADPFFQEVNNLKNAIIAELGGEPLTGNDLSLKRGGLGGVAHEVGTLRLGPAGQAVVDTNLKFHGLDNLFVCDLSVFPTSPAANPTLTLAALAFRLADHIKSKFP